MIWPIIIFGDKKFFWMTPQNFFPFFLVNDRSYSVFDFCLKKLMDSSKSKRVFQMGGTIREIIGKIWGEIFKKRWRFFWLALDKPTIY
jgi:hypothetical protein